MRFTRITIIRERKPEKININELLQWFGGTLGLFSQRDKDRSCFRVFIVLLKDIKTNKRGLSSDEIADLTALTRGTVVHHLNRLMEAGLVSVERNKYMLKVDNLSELVDTIKKEVDNAFIQLKDVGEKLDVLLGLK